MNACLPKLLITGSQGQVGSALCSHPLAAKFLLHAYTHAQVDITNKHSIEQAILQTKPDAIINTAAYTAVDKAQDEPDRCFSINHLGTQYLAECAQQHRIPLIHLSTDYVFSGETNKPRDENDPAAPLNVYGQSKWMGEQAIREYCGQHIILRISGVFSQFGNNFLKTILRLARERKELRIVADQITCPTYAVQIAEVIFTIASRLSHWGTYHYCSSPAISWYQFASNIVLQASQRETLMVETIQAITTQDYPTKARRPAYSVLDCHKIKRDYGIEPDNWELGISEALNA